MHHRHSFDLQDPNTLKIFWKFIIYDERFDYHICIELYKVHIDNNGCTKNNVCLLKLIDDHVLN